MAKHRASGPQGYRWMAPPNWPPPPEGWYPPLGWEPEPSWGPAPDGWQFWQPFVGELVQPVTDPAKLSPAPTPAPPVMTDDHVSVFGAKRRVRELSAEVAQLRAELERTGALTLHEIEQQIETQRAEQQHMRETLEAEIVAKRAEAEERAIERGAEAERKITKVTAEYDDLNAKTEALRSSVVVTEEVAMLQEVGIYEYRHPLDDAVSYQSRLKALQDRIKTMAKSDRAVSHTTNWTVNNSLAKGRAMVRDFSKLMLRAYNAEADNLVRSLKPYKLEASIDRLTKVVATIERLGKTMDIRVSSDYHRLRVEELELTSDYLAKAAEQKEREREERQRLREERIAQAEIERERARLEKEKQHNLNAHQALLAKGDHEGAARLQEVLVDIDRAITDVDYRAANVRAGYVYVISNIGAFGEDMVKIGMTRRLDPMDRVRELGDASVPFRFDVHALHFSQDAVAIETALHQRFADRRVNMVNPRREFFRATPAEVKDAFASLTGDILEFTELAEAVEYRQSLTALPTTAPGRDQA